MNNNYKFYNHKETTLQLQRLFSSEVMERAGIFLLFFFASTIHGFIEVQIAQNYTEIL